MKGILLTVKGILLTVNNVNKLAHDILLVNNMNKLAHDILILIVYMPAGDENSTCPLVITSEI